MRDLTRIVGGMYVGWAVLQTVALAVLALLEADDGPRTSGAAAVWAAAFVIAAAFAVVGMLLRRHDPAARVPGIALAALALLYFPVGTAIGAFALWALLGHAHEARAGA